MAMIPITPLMITMIYFIPITHEVNEWNILLATFHLIMTDHSILTLKVVSFSLSFGVNYILITP